MTSTVDDKAEVLPDDILSAILTLAWEESEQDRFSFRAHGYKLQEIFYDLSQEHPLLQEFFVYSDTGPQPYSPALNEAITRLQFSGFLSRDCPDHEVMRVRPAAKEYFTAVLGKRLNQEGVDKLQLIARDFLGYVRIE